MTRTLGTNRWVGAVSVAVLLSITAACTPAPQPPTTTPSSFVMPTIVGDTISDSPLEADEWVIAARAAMLGSVLANNAADFSIEPFVSSMTPEGAELQFNFWSSRFVGEGKSPLTWPGPEVSLPISVELLDGGDRAIVRFCDGSDFWENEDAGALETGVERTATLVRTDAGLRQESSTAGSVPCDATGAPIGRFDPVPAPIGELTVADVVPPPQAN